MPKYIPNTPSQVRENNKKREAIGSTVLNNPTITLEIPSRIQKQLNNGKTTTEDIITYVRNTIYKRCGINNKLEVIKVKEDNSAVIIVSFFMVNLIERISNAMDTNTFWDKFVTEEELTDNIIIRDINGDNYGNALDGLTIK